MKYLKISLCVYPGGGGGGGYYNIIDRQFHEAMVQAL